MLPAQQAKSIVEKNDLYKHMQLILVKSIKALVPWKKKMQLIIKGRGPFYHRKQLTFMNLKAFI